MAREAELEAIVTDLLKGNRLHLVLHDLVTVGWEGGREGGKGASDREGREGVAMRAYFGKGFMRLSYRLVLLFAFCSLQFCLNYGFRLYRTCSLLN